LVLKTFKDILEKTFTAKIEALHKKTPPLG